MVGLWLARCLVVGAHLGLLEMVNANLKFQRTIHLVFSLGESTNLVQVFLLVQMVFCPLMVYSLYKYVFM